MRTIEDYEKAFEDAKAKAREDGGKAAYEARARLMNQYTTGVEPKRVKEIMEAERDGRFDKAAIIDKDAGLYGMTEGEAKLANAILAALGNPEEAEAAFKAAAAPGNSKGNGANS